MEDTKNAHQLVWASNVIDFTVTASNLHEPAGNAHFSLETDGFKRVSNQSLGLRDCGF